MLELEGMFIIAAIVAQFISFGLLVTPLWMMGEGLRKGSAPPAWFKHRYKEQCDKSDKSEC